jgi:hypothetical protein
MEINPNGKLTAQAPAAIKRLVLENVATILRPLIVKWDTEMAADEDGYLGYGLRVAKADVQAVIDGAAERIKKMELP